MRGYYWRQMRDQRGGSQKSTWELLRSSGRLISYIRPWWYIMAVLLALMTAITALQLVRPWLIKTFIDDAVPSGDLRLHTLLGLAFVGTLVGGRWRPPFTTT
jgi:ABC-type bacteriocin/lantibiotic exporter with double-glycine peptidase domain